MLAKGVCHDHEMVRLADLSTHLETDIHDHQDQLASFMDKNMMLE